MSQYQAEMSNLSDYIICFDCPKILLYALFNILGAPFWEFSLNKSSNEVCLNAVQKKTFIKFILNICFICD